MSRRLGGGGRPPRRLAQHIAWLALLLIAPAIALGAALSLDLAGRLRAVAEQSLKSAAQAAALAVAHEVEARWLLLKALTLQPEAPAEGPALLRLAAAAAAVLETPPDLAFRPLAAETPGPAEPVPAIARRPGSDGTAELVVIAAAPRGDGSSASFALPLPEERLGLALSAAALPAGGFALLVDRDGGVLARAPSGTAPAAAPSWLAGALGAGAAGVLRGPGEGRRALVLAAAPVGIAGWTVLVGQPETAFTARWQAPALGYLAGGLLVAALGLALAGWFAARLQRALPAVERLGAPSPAAPRVAEFEALGQAVRAAQEALRAEAANAAAVAAENRRLAEEAANDRQLLLSIMQSAPDPIFVKDTALRYVLVNERAAATVGMRAVDMIGRRDVDLLDPADAAAVNAADRRVLESGTTVEQERAVVSPLTGRRRLLRTVKAPWRDRNGEVIGVVGIARDVTQRVEAEQRLRAAEEAMRRIARADALTVMSLGIAHELNQPLTAATNFLRASLRWLDRAPEDPARLAAARAAIQEGSAEVLRAAEILRRLRDFIGRGETERAVLPLGGLLAETAGLIRAARGEGELEIALDLPEAPCGVLGDGVQLQQVFVNLLRNAVEATEGLADRGLALTLRREGGEAVVVVADRGPGLPPEVTERLFEPFVSTRPEGMGIGLSISRTIVESHGGRIDARPREGGGTEFVVRLPLAEG